MRSKCSRLVRPGFTLLEILVVVILMGIAIGIAAPTVGNSLSKLRMQRAATVIAADLRLGPSLAARQRQAVVLNVDDANRSYTISTAATNILLVDRRFGSTTEFVVTQMVAASPTVFFYPNGLASDSVRITIRGGGERKVIRMTRAGQVRIQQ